MIKGYHNTKISDCINCQEKIRKDIELERDVDANKITKITGGFAIEKSDRNNIIARGNVECPHCGTINNWETTFVIED